jgi:ribulose-phosphate 3-epimerase
MGISTNQFKMITNNFDSLVDGYHLDIMDGLFVQSKSLPLDALYGEIKALTQKPLWAHLMTIDPLISIKKLTKLCETTVSFHIEINHEINEMILAIKEKMGHPSLAINPGTSIFALKPFLNQIDHITLMSVNPGLSGQKFIPESIVKLNQARQLCDTQNKSMRIACDGGINETNIVSIQAAKASEIVLSSALFKYKKVAEQIKALENIRSLI